VDLTGVEEEPGVADGMHLNLYPNPAGRQLTLAPSLTPSTNWGRGGARAVGGSHLIITDLYGREVMKFEKISSLPYLIDISKLPDGLYILQLISVNGEGVSGKFLKISE
jgi:hypothetical protein